MLDFERCLCVGRRGACQQWSKAGRPKVGVCGMAVNGMVESNHLVRSVFTDLLCYVFSFFI